MPVRNTLALLAFLDGRISQQQNRPVGRGLVLGGSQMNIKSSVIEGLIFCLLAGFVVVFFINLWAWWGPTPPETFQAASEEVTRAAFVAAKKSYRPGAEIDQYLGPLDDYAEWPNYVTIPSYRIDDYLIIGTRFNSTGTKLIGIVTVYTPHKEHGRHIADVEELKPSKKTGSLIYCAVSDTGQTSVEQSTALSMRELESLLDDVVAVQP
ncbi:hypothetical protein OAU50_08445 [Planctomycetota bacterium]|nr:hypothetical protein [Planctomycetota bacterium]